MDWVSKCAFSQVWSMSSCVKLKFAAPTIVQNKMDGSIIY